MEFHHRSILLPECMEALAIDPAGVYVDGTLGGGGHSEAICRHLTTGRLIGIDRDTDALRAAGKRLAPFGDRVTLIHNNYENLPQALAEAGVERVDGILLDLGVSSYQLDEAERGFSYQHDAPLDMRMDRSNPLSAYQVVNELPQELLADILWRYGEEQWSKRIAEFIVRARQERPLATTGELVAVIKQAVPKGARREGPHPAKRSFQAIRIAVNDELGGLERVLERIPACLNDGGRVAIITFHSLEDRMVKEAFRTWADPCTCPRDFPVCVCGKKPLGRVVTRKPLVPSAGELEENPRARSAKLRVFERRLTKD